MRTTSLRRWLPLALGPAVLVAESRSLAAQATADTVRAITAPRTPLPAEAASRSNTRFSFIAYGDSRGRRDGEVQQHEHWLVVDGIVRTVAAMANGPDPVRFVLWSGDAVVNGRVAQQWNASFIDNVNRITTEAGIPFFPAPGNHDVTASPDKASVARQAGLRNYLSAFRNLIPPDGSPRRLAGYPTFAVGYGNTFAIAFDSNIAADSIQFEWIRGQLEGLDRRRYTNVVVYCHQPAFSSGPHGGSNVEAATTVIRAKYMPLFRKHNVRMFFSGHEHLFEHWVERYQDTSGQPRRIDHIVSGGGGAPLYSYFGEPDLREDTRVGAAEKVALEHLVRPGADPGQNPYHFTLVRVDGDKIRVEVVGVDFGAGFRPYRTRGADLNDPVPIRP
jgi:hypothetical protein